MCKIKKYVHQLKIIKNTGGFFIFILFLVFFSIPADCANGDVAGDYYQTDIKTYLYYSPITAYNIGGQTVIDAEILNWHYGFDVYWFSDERQLEISDKGGRFNSLQAMNGSLCEYLNGNIGDVVGNYFETDIITTLNGKAITSYNIGGRTCILAEEMRDFGYDVVWNPEERTLRITKPSDFYKIATDYGVIETDTNFKSAPNFFIKTHCGVILSNDLENYFELLIPSQYKLATLGGVSFVKLSDLCSVLNAECTLIKSLHTAHTEWINGVSYDEDYFDYCIKLTFASNEKPELNPAQSDYEVEEFSDFDKNNCYEMNHNIELELNGRRTAFHAMYGGKIFDTGIMIIDNEIYIPTYMIGEIIGYKYAY